MAVANPQKSNLLHLHKVPFADDMKWKEYVDSTAKSAAKKIGALCQARHFSILYIYLIYLTYL